MGDYRMPGDLEIAELVETVHRHAKFPKLGPLAHAIEQLCKKLSAGMTGCMPHPRVAKAIQDEAADASIELVIHGLQTTVLKPVQASEVDEAVEVKIQIGFEPTIGVENLPSQSREQAVEMDEGYIDALLLNGRRVSRSVIKSRTAKAKRRQGNLTGVCPTGSSSRKG